MKRSLAWAGAAAVLTAVAAGCTTEDTAQPNASDSTPPPSQTAAVAAPPITWGGGGDIAQLHAIIIGDLDRNGECWGIDLAGDEGRALVAWPKGTEYDGDAVRTPDGSIYRAGDRLEGGGGRQSLDGNLGSMIDDQADRLKACREGELNVVFIN